MTTPETRPAGTAARIAELEAALTRANAATAAAYEVAARACSGIIKDYYCMKDDGKTYHPLWVQKVAKGMVSIARQDIRALATPDQTAALDKLIAEAVKPYADALDAIAQEASVPVHTWQNGINFKRMYEGWRKIATERIDMARAILAASKKGGV